MYLNGIYWSWFDQFPHYGMGYKVDFKGLKEYLQKLLGDAAA